MASTIFAVAFLTLPTSAFADTTTTEDADINGRLSTVIDTANTKNAAPIARIGDTTYPSLQDAISNVKGNETIVLLEDTSENIKIESGEFVIDLNGHTLASNDEFIFTGIAVNICGSTGLTVTIKNGTVSGYYTGIYVENSAANVFLEEIKASGSYEGVRVYGGEVTVVEGNTPSSFSGTSWRGSGLRCSKGKATIEDGLFDNNPYGVCVEGSGNLIIHDGTFGTTSGESALEVSGGTTTVNGGTFNNTINSTVDTSKLIINEGKYVDYSAAPFAAGGKVLAQGADGHYALADPAIAKSQAQWVVSSKYDNNAFKAYFNDESAAQSAYDEYRESDPDTTIKAIYRVEFVSQDKTVELRYLEEGEAIGTLPANTEIAGYDFLGWYKNGDPSDANKLAETSTIDSNITAVALWEKDKGGNPDPNPDTIGPNDSDKTKPSSSDDPSDSKDSASNPNSSKQSPQTGDMGTHALAFAVLCSAALAAVAARRCKTE